MHFDWVDTGRLNAFAFKADDRYFIGATAGSLGLLGFVFNRMLRHPTILPHIGDAGRETVDELIPIGAWEDLKTVHQSGCTFDGPADPTRGWFAAHLTSLAFDFLLAHELTHIWHGHVDLGGASGHSFVRAEVRRATGGLAELDRLLIDRTIEMDADAKAACTGVQLIQDAIGNPSAVGEPWSQFFRTPAEAIFNWSFAMATLFRLFGDEHFVGPGAFLDDHPPPRVRSAMANGVALEWVRLRWPAMWTNEVINAATQGALAAEEAFASVTGQPVNWASLLAAHQQPGWEHGDAMRACWRDHLWQALQPHAFVQLPGREPAGEGEGPPYPPVV